jgi:hypothetical protein
LDPRVEGRCKVIKTVNPRRLREISAVRQQLGLESWIRQVGYARSARRNRDCQIVQPVSPGYSRRLLGTQRVHKASRQIDFR